MKLFSLQVLLSLRIRKKSEDVLLLADKLISKLITSILPLLQLQRLIKRILGVMTIL